MDNEQQRLTAAPAVQATAASVCRHSEVTSERQGAQINEALQAKLQSYLDR